MSETWDEWVSREKALRVVVRERMRQEERKAMGRFKHTCADPEIEDFERRAILMEEVGEVARETLVMDGDREDRKARGTHEALRYELAQTAAVCVAWIEYIDNYVHRKRHLQLLGYDQIRFERMRQIHEEGYTHDHDAAHTHGELLDAAACYLFSGSAEARYHDIGRKLWPFERESWKPTPEDRILELKKAGALIAAEIDRLQGIGSKIGD